jgi:beta-galactosidase
MPSVRLCLFAALCISCTSAFAADRTEFNGDFAPAEGWIKSLENEFRYEICLNGLWQFQAVSVPDGWQPNRGTPPELPPPKDDAWEQTPIKIPSAWNVNTWGNGRHVGAGTDRPYFPDSVYYPSYPEHWDGVRMAWMKRSFTLPNNFTGKRILLHFEAVSGMAEIYVNGKKTGENFGRFLPFDVDITDAVLFDGKPNELSVGVRSLRLYDKTSEKYAKMRTPYAPGSNMDNLNGIWQDVYLLALPAVRIEDVFVKPFVHRDTLEIEITLKNDLRTPQTVAVEGGAYTWLRFPDPNTHWALDKIAALPVKRSKAITLPAGQSITLTLSENVGSTLKHWTMDEPNLYGLVLDVLAEGKKVDTKYTRFGWREFRIVGKNLELNGKPVKLVGDLLHPFGPFISSRKYVESWYTMVKEMHGNAVRPHA